MRLGPTGSGLWIYDSAGGRILQDAEGQLAYIPRPALLPASKTLPIFVSERLVGVWLGNHIAISTRYQDGKPYAFSVLKSGKVVHWQW